MGKYFLLLIPVLSFLTGCGSMQTVSVPAMRPAPFHVGNHIQRVAVIDRTSADHNLANLVESVITGELPGLHREATESALDGLVTTLRSSPRFDVVRTTEGLRTRNILGSWPRPLDWDEVANLAEKYDADAIISLESFNSDFIVTHGSRTPERSSDGGRRSTGSSPTVYFAEGIATIKIGFRVYDLANRSISDSHMFDHSARWEATGSTVQDAVAQLITHRKAVINTSYRSGTAYATRISPQWVTLRRQFYKKAGNDRDFSIGARRATVNDWDGAADAWHRSVNSPDPKTAGRSAYNLALMYEISGELETARQWAQMAYTDFGVKKARRYVYALDGRIRDEAVTAEQMR